MRCRPFVRRGDPEQHRFAERQGKKIDAHAKLCRYWADQAHTTGAANSSFCLFLRQPICYGYRALALRR